jgi:hypothetical protein
VVVASALLGPVVFASGVGLIGGAPSAGAAGAPCAFNSVQPVTTTADTSLDMLFQAYGNSGTGKSWTGGDGTESVALPDGRELWLFDDSFLGKVKAGLRNRKRSPYLHNAAVVENQGVITGTIYTAHRRKSTAFVNPVPRATYKYGFWPGGSIVNGDTLQVLGTELKFAPGAFTFSIMHDSIATFELPSLTLVSLTALPPSGIDWSQSVSNEGGYTYLYGIKGGSAYAARVAGTNLEVPWTYYNGSAWTTTASTAAPIERGVGSHFSVSAVGGAYALVTMPSLVGNNVDAAFGCSPVGPFGPQQTIYSTPEQSRYPSKDGVITYGAHAHPELSNSPNTLVISYDVNAIGPLGLSVKDSSLYRPRFIVMTLG